MPTRSVAPAGTVPSVTVTVLPLRLQLKTMAPLIKEPQDTKVIPDGILKVTVTLSAGAPPIFVTVMSNPTVPAPVTGFGRSLIVICNCAGKGTRLSPLGTHVAPESVVLKRPPPAVPAYSVDEFVGSKASVRTIGFVRPADDGDHVVAPSVLLKIWATNEKLVATYNVELCDGSMTRAKMFNAASPVFIGAQFAPPFVLLNTPAAVPA